MQEQKQTLASNIQKLAVSSNVSSPLKQTAIHRKQDDNDSSEDDEDDEDEESSVDETADDEQLDVQKVSDPIFTTPTVKKQPSIVPFIVFFPNVSNRKMLLCFRQRQVHLWQIRWMRKQEQEPTANDFV